MRKRLALLSALGVMGLLAACTGNVSLGKAPPANAAGAGDGGGDGDAQPAVTGPYDINCKFSLRRAGGLDFDTKEVPLRSDATSHTDFTGAGFTVDVDIAPAADAPTDAILVIKTRENEAVQQFRLEKTNAPVAQMDGFTGLVELGPTADVQYVCSSPSSRAAPIQASATPVNIVCNVELRSAPGGAIEQSGAYTFDKLETSINDVYRSFEASGYGVRLGFSDSAAEGRLMFATAWAAGASEGTPAIHQLFQLNRNATLVNQLSNTSFTGRGSIGIGTHKELSYVCSARSGVAATGRSACSTGPRYPSGTTFPVITPQDLSVAGDHDCLPRCGTPAESIRRIDAVPNGACSVENERCNIGVDYYDDSNTSAPCRADGMICDCRQGAWSCSIVTQGGGICGPSVVGSGTVCAQSHFDAGSAAPSCQACGDNEICYTQVSCGPAGSPGCTLGAQGSGDDRCHRTCTKDDECGANGECVKRDFFACTDYNAHPAGGRGICCIKGVPC